MPGLESICVFCGSNPGADARYGAAAEGLGHELALRGIRVVYGGGRTGLMGRMADSAMEHGGNVIGVIPGDLMPREVAHTGITELRVVDSMHQRKATMATLADGFVVLPGGLGTMEEAFEVWTWTQLGIHRKPVGFLNVAGYFDPLVDFLDHMAAQRFVGRAHREIAAFEATAAALLDRMETLETPATGKWLELDQT